jgi:hypothetical protein
VSATEKLIRVPHERQDRVIDGQPGLGARSFAGLLNRWDAASGIPLGDNATVRLMALGRVVPAEIDVVTVDPDDRKIAGLLMALFGRLLIGRRCGHFALP